MAESVKRRMNLNLSAYLRRTAIISAIVSSLLSLFFAMLVSRGRAMVPLWGLHGIAFDFLPQLFVLTLTMTLAITLSTHRRLATGFMAPLPALRFPVPRNALLRAVTFAVIVTAALAPPSIGLLMLAGVTGAPSALFVLAKVIYGAVVSFAIAPPIARAALCLDRTTGAPPLAGG